MIERKLTLDNLMSSQMQLREHKAALEQKNIDMKQILKQVQEEKERIKKNVIENAEKVLMPSLYQLLSSPNKKKIYRINGKQYKKSHLFFWSQIDAKSNTA